MYEYMSQQGFLLIIEAEGRSIGECCLERMNLDWVKERYPGEHIYRLPITIGDRQCWGRGYGTEVVMLSLRYAFEHLGADRFFIPGVWAFNERSLRLWKRCGFEEVGRQPETLDRRGEVVETETVFFSLTCEDFQRRIAPGRR